MSPLVDKSLLTLLVELGIVTAESHENLAVLVSVAPGLPGGLEGSDVVVNEFAGAQLGSRCVCAGDAVGVNDLVWLLWLGVDL